MRTNVDNVAVFHPSGEIDRQSGEVLVKNLQYSLQTVQGKIVLDLSRVEHLHYLVACDLLKLVMLARFGAGEIKIINAQPSIQAILEFVGGDFGLESYPTVAEAVFSFGESQGSVRTWH